MRNYCELHAITLPDGKPVHIARVDGDSDDELFRAACELASMVGVRGED